MALCVSFAVLSLRFTGALSIDTCIAGTPCADTADSFEADINVNLLQSAHSMRKGNGGKIHKDHPDGMDGGRGNSGGNHSGNHGGGHSTD